MWIPVNPAKLLFISTLLVDGHKDMDEDGQLCIINLHWGFHENMFICGVAGDGPDVNANGNDAGIPQMNFSNSIWSTHLYIPTCCSSTICNFHFHLFLGKILFNSHLEHNLTLSPDELNMFPLNLFYPSFLFALHPASSQAGRTLASSPDDVDVL